MVRAIQCIVSEILPLLCSSTPLFPPHLSSPEEVLANCPCNQISNLPAGSPVLCSLATCMHVDRGPDPPTSQTDRRTSCNRNTTLCTKVHRAVKTASFFGRIYFNVQEKNLHKKACHTRKFLAQVDCVSWVLRIHCGFSKWVCPEGVYQQFCLRFMLIFGIDRNFYAVKSLFRRRSARDSFLSFVNAITKDYTL